MLTIADLKPFARAYSQNDAVAQAEQFFDASQPEQGALALETAAAAGDMGAQVWLAKRLLVGRGVAFEPQRALDLLNAASARDEPDAVAQLATFASNGAWRPKDWDLAMQLLLKAAELGSYYARGQLIVLAADRDLAKAALTGSEAGLWPKLAATVNIKALCGPVPKINALEKPRIRVVERFATPEICDWLVCKGLGRFQPSMMFDGQKSNFLASRTCSDFKFDIVEGDLVMGVVRERVSVMTTIPSPCFEPPQIFHYALGQEIKAHYDSLRLGDQGYGRDGGYKGDRIVTMLVYLNDDYDGGVLEFPKVQFRHRGKKGDAVYFASVDAENKPEKLSLHAALPITRGEKFILSQWIHDRVFTA